MEKKQAESLTNDIVITDILIRLKTLEALLIKKGVFSQEEFDEQNSIIAKKIVKSILKQANVVGNLDEYIEKMMSTDKN